MFHVGHLNIFRRSKEQCERLIVGVSTDELVMQYKHKFPIVHLHDRMEILAAIRYVDVIFLPHTEGISTTILTEIIHRKRD